MRTELRNWKRMPHLPLDNARFKLALEAAFYAKTYDELFSAGKRLRQFGYKIHVECAEIYLEKLDEPQTTENLV